MDGIKKALTEKDKALLIVNKYLDQLGGVEKLNAIKSIKSSYIMTVMNMDMTVDTY